MIRKDREVTDKNKICEIISNCYCCRLGLIDNKKVYIVPLSFGYIEKNGIYTFYFHSAKIGHKIDLIKQNQYVGFEMDTNYKLKENKIACNYSASFQSIIGNGKIYFIEDIKEKKFALQEIMLNNAKKSGWEFSEIMIKNVTVFKLVTNELSCKENI